LDTRIFSKECISLSEKYEVFLFAPLPFIYHPEIKHRTLPAFKHLFIRILITHPFLFLKLLLTKRAAVYHFHDPELLPFGLLLSFFRCKVIYDVHEWVEADFSNKNIPFGGFFRYLYKVFENRSLKKLHFILAESSYKQYYQNRVANFTTVLNYPDCNSFQEFKSTSRHSRSLFYIGNITGKRGLPQMIRLLNLLNAKNEEFHLICIGEKNKVLKKQLPALPEYSKVKDQLHFYGYLQISEAMKHSVECLAGLALYDDLPNHRDSLSTKMLEYMSVGLPVITSSFPLYQDIIEKNSCGYCIDPDNTEQIAAAVLELFHNPQLAEDMSRKGISTIQEKYCWESEKQKLFELYENMLA
jgi:glycosyltransferase involved in cell wall biosynthesis